MAPHPYLQDAWFFAPLVNAEAQANCIFELDGSGNKDFAWEDMFTACNDPMPFVLHRVTGKWHRGPLSIAGLPSLAALDLAARQSLWGTYQTVELAYATQGSGAFRGSLRW